MGMGFGSVSKLTRPVRLSVVGAGFACPKNCFRASKPRPYELNDSIIHVLTTPILFMGRYLINKYDKK